MSPMFRPNNTSLQSVDELIDTPDAEAILNIPIRTGGGDDFFAWDFENSGVYSVMSAYRALLNQKESVALEEGTVTVPQNQNNRCGHLSGSSKLCPR